jgi:hypothetical protein
MLLPQDRQLIETWTTHGMPDNTSTREHAVKLLGQLVNEMDELHRIIDQLAQDEDVTS